MKKALLVIGLLLVALPALAQATASYPDHYSLPPDKLIQATNLYHTELLMFAVSWIYSIALLWAFLRFDVGVTFRDFAEYLSPKRIPQLLVTFPLIFLALRILSLPLSIFGHHISLAYGLSIQPWGLWFIDWLKVLAVDVVVATFVCFGLFRIIDRSPRRWWLWAWAISIPLTILAVWILPVVLDPMFNKFEPLQQTNPALVEQLSRVAHRGGLDIPPSRMFEMKASEKVTTYNAYVTGVGSTKRVVVWDTTERDMTTPETLFVFGHEMGHYVLDHIWKGIACSAFLTFFGIWIGKSLYLRLIASRGEDWGIRGSQDAAALPLMLLIFTVLSFASMPIDSAISRFFEHQADMYGLEVTHSINADSPEVAASSFQKLGEKSLDYPDPNGFYVFWTYSHPPIADRLRFALRYRPWEQGRPMQFVK